MRRSSDSWGLGVFILSILAVVGVFLLATLVLPDADEAVDRLVLPILTAVAGAAVFFVGHFSYPRVQNLKIYLAGYVTGLVALAYVGLAVLFPGRSNGFVYGLFALAVVNAFLVSVVPQFLKYHITRTVTWVAMGSELTAILIMRFLVDWSLVPSTVAAVSTINAVALGVTAVVIFFAFALVDRGFHLQGLVAGYAVLFYGCWVAGLVWPATEEARALAFVALPAYLTVAAVLHWFARIEHRASYDPLLQIYNRDYCAGVLSEQSPVSTRPPFALAMIDIDHFKKVNDTYGHQAGDHVLFSVAQRIQKTVVPEGVVCRYGGEEIAVFFPRHTGRQVIPRLQDVRRQIEEMELVHRGKRISVTVSIGVSYRYLAHQRLEDVVRAADKALYMCKNHGRNQIRMVRIKEREPIAKTV